MTMPAVNIRALWPVGLFLTLCVLLAVGLTRDPSRLPTELQDAPFPAFEIGTLADPDAGITEAIFQGKVSLVNVFGSWCASCVVEHPYLMTLGQDTDLQMVGIDWRDSRENGARWLAQYGNPYDVVLFDGDSALAISLGITGAPETFLVGPDGRVRHKHVGIMDADVWQRDFMPRIKSIEGGA